MKKLLLVLITIAFAIGAEAQQFSVRNGLKTNVRIRIKSFPSCNNGNGCEATSNPGIGQIFPPGSTSVNSCIGTNQFGNAAVGIWNGFTFVNVPSVVGICSYPLNTGVFVAGIGMVLVNYLQGPTPVIWIHL